MSVPHDEKQMPVVAVFRSPVFNPSEGFIQDQAAALTRYRPIIVGLERKGEVAPPLREGLILPATAGLVVWIVLWALGSKGFDAFMLAAAIVLVGATLRLLSRYLPGRRT